MRNWLEFAVQLVGLGAALTIPLAALAALRGDARWLTRKEWEVSEKNQAQRLAEVVIGPLEKIARQMEAISVVQAKTLEGQVRQEEINKSIGRSLDDLRDDIKDLKRDAG